MNPRELVDHIRSGPVELVLDEPLRFRRRTRSNPCDFNEFLRVLRSSETIRSLTCAPHRILGITEDEWVLLVKTLGIIKCIDDLTLCCQVGSRDYHPFQAIAEAVNSAHSLRKLAIEIKGIYYPMDPSGLTVLANTLQEHTILEKFTWLDYCSHIQLEAVQITAVDPILQTLSACPHLRNVAIMTKCASTDAIQTLLQLRPATVLHLIGLGAEYWMAVADAIRRGRCHVQMLTFAMCQITRSEATEAVQAIANAIQLDCNLEQFVLQMENEFFSDETANKTLRVVTLAYDNFFRRPHRAPLGALAYDAFSAMLRVNTSLVLKVPIIDIAVRDEKLIESHDQMVIEQRLNIVGRGRLLTSSNRTTSEEWVDALHRLNFSNVNDPPAFLVSCLYSLLRLKPSVVCMPWPTQ
jgi:hypothetical protein